MFTNQFTYSIYEDPYSADLTNPVTGAAPLSLTPPSITSEPQSERLYAGATATFTIGATGGGLNYQWQTNGVAIGNGGNISGATSSTLTISNVSAANAVSYSCLVSNANTIGYQTTNSAPAVVTTLTIVSPNGAYETALAAASPQHFYAFDDTGSPSSGTEVAVDYTGGDNGIYGINTQNGSVFTTGPQPTEDGLPGFYEGNAAAAFAIDTEPNHITMNSPWNFNTNTVTITAWINPNGAQGNSAGIVFNRGGGSDVEGLNYSANGDQTLSYTWNNDAGTTGWDSGLQPPSGQWSFVTLVVTPTNATISMMNTNGLLSSTHVFAHVPAAFGGTTMIGDDSGTTSGARIFTGSIDEVAVFNQALTQSQLQSIFTNASQVALYPPTTNSIILLTPTPTVASLAAQFSLQTQSGSLPLSYTWQINGNNLTDGAGSFGTIYGSATSFLTISNLVAGTDFATLVTSNQDGSVTSSVPVQLIVNSPSASQTIFTLGKEVSGLDWNTASNWNDNLPASTSVFYATNSTYQIVPNTMERTPGLTNAVFPSSGSGFVSLVVQGDGTISDGNLATFPTNVVGNVTNVTGELRTAQTGATSVTNFGTVYTDGGTIYFPDLQLAGGQVDAARPSKVTFNGQIDVLSNSAFYSDSGAGGSIRPIQINSFLTGSGTLTYAYLSTGATNDDLIISGTTNTFSGQWNVTGGTLLGQAANSLGTNTITIGTNSALETTYNINNPNGNLILNGQMFLYTTNVFHAMTVNGSPVLAGTYTSAQLNGLYPGSFPTNWNVQVGSQTGTNTGVGQLTILKTLLPQIIQQPTPASLSLYPGQTAQFTVTGGGATSYQWWFTNLINAGVKLSDGGTISGSLSNVLTISSVASGNAGNYMVVLSNSVGSVTSSIRDVDHFDNFACDDKHHHVRCGNKWTGLEHDQHLERWIRRFTGFIVSLCGTGKCLCGIGQCRAAHSRQFGEHRVPGISVDNCPVVWRDWCIDS